MSTMTLSKNDSSAAETPVSIICSNYENLELDALSINPMLRTVFLNQKPLQLTRKEYELLLYFTKHPNRVISRDEIMCRIWGYDFIGNTRTLDTHVKMLRSKLETYGERIRTVRCIGYLYTGGNNS